MFDALIRELKTQHGVEFASVEETLADPAYDLRPEVGTRYGINYLVRLAWERATGFDENGQPTVWANDPIAFGAAVTKIFNDMNALITDKVQVQLDTICPTGE